ncbi:MAG: ergothioneine biosynthesis protein EgtB [Erythrobacter sp.]|uniref:ergothioneine biosynthesis protein EgtB n=1 Tax=Erythrobacter sp. TaxID=1042 RepID=UPI0026280ED6|nr:ergothioneine biosynthesis protein EgtB [Erythrobacter sp.]MDJ0978860.1 ergothioneine biosynthesis protein EgtB [Erythrobacter sp.]
MSKTASKRPDPGIAGSPGEPGLARRFAATRALSEALVAPLSEADACLQSMEDASPAKWHLAHTTWFWETFLLRDRRAGYRLFDDRYPYLFNSYYEAEGARHARCARGLLSRPSLVEILEWRAVVDRAMEDMLDDPALSLLIELGIAHEQQHIELLLTDIKHALFQNPLGPQMWESAPGPCAGGACAGGAEMGWHAHPGGVARIGHDGEGFAFDNEGPAHRVLLEPFTLADGLITNAEWDQFIADGGYRTASLWLADGWAWVNENAITAPLYWRGAERFTHTGWRERDPNAPVTHISQFEADAFAGWAGARLPTEFEWEAIARGQDAEGTPAAHDANAGNQLDRATPPDPRGGGDLFGDVWQFTSSAYLPYPRFRVAEGAVGEYNGKFMSGQSVLKGASCASVRGHSRASYRNFFYPHQRWQFTGLRLAKDL